MDREKAKELLPVIQALAEGKEIEYFSTIKNEWLPTLKIFNEKFSYRVKAESAYRPFDGRGELLETMSRSKLPFGWFRFKDLKEFGQILYISNDWIACARGIDTVTYTYEEAFKYLTFLDGSPFGAKKE